MKYICIKPFEVEICDENGFFTGSFTLIEKGTVWESDDNTSIIGGQVHLDGKNGEWIEISAETLDECFERFEENEK